MYLLDTDILSLLFADHPRVRRDALSILEHVEFLHIRMRSTALEPPYVRWALKPFTAGGALGLQDFGHGSLPRWVDLITTGYGAWVGPEVTDRRLQLFDPGHRPCQRGGAFEGSALRASVACASRSRSLSR
jgi:hypothetical protein